MYTNNLAVDENVNVTTYGAGVDGFDVDDDHGGTVPYDELGTFESIDDLEEFLAKFEASTDDEAEVLTQGDADVGGTPTSDYDAIHTKH